MNWQTPTAMVVVGVTALIFLVRIFRKKTNCGGNCCSIAKRSPQQKDSSKK